MARNSKKAGAGAATSTPQIPAGERIYLSPDSIQKWADTQILEVYSEDFGGWLHARMVGADRFARFLEAKGDVENLNAMAQIVSEILCNADGSDFITKEQAMKYPVLVLDKIMGDVAKARKEAKGNG